MGESLDYSGRRETPGSVGAGPGAVIHGAEGSQRVVLVIIFMTMDELRVAGPLALRPWLERRMRQLRRGPGEVVEFHQEARSRGGS